MMTHRETIGEIARLIRRWCRAGVALSELNALYEFTAAILLTRSALGYSLPGAAKALGYRAADLAHSLAGDLLAAPPERNLLIAYLGQHLEQDDCELYARFRSGAVMFASQQLYHRWHEVDPAGAKLTTAVKAALHGDGRLRIFPASEPSWVALANATDLRETLAPWREEELLGLLLQLYPDGDCTKQRLYLLLAAVAQDDYHHGAVPIELLCRVVRRAEVLLEAFAQRDSLQPEPRNPQLPIATKTARDEALSLARARLLTAAGKHQVCDSTRQHLLRALQDLLHDYAVDQANLPHWHYVRRYAAEVDGEDYRRRLRWFDDIASDAKIDFCRKVEEKLE